MTFNISSKLAYNVQSSGTLILSTQCMQTSGQIVSNESFTTSREVDYQELSLGLGGNRFSRIALEKGGPLEIDYTAEVKTSYQLVDRSDIDENDTGHIPPEAIPFLFPSRYCESDALRQEAAELFPDQQSQYEKVEAIVDWVHKNVDYVSGSTGELTSAADVIEGKQGVCRDFAHLCIALCRALCIPARYATVYAYKLEPQDFHAVFEVYIGHAWFMFDATHLAPLNGLVRISSGRDAADTAVASVYGAIQGSQPPEVSCEIAEENFEPVTRKSLKEQQKAFILL